jgi:murein DD-endopeptidase MepM/ murein hydrolase activator NlpD
MKTSKLILSSVCAMFLAMPTHAQFNTIGTTNSKHIKTVNPPKSNETLTDSTEADKPAPQPMESTVTHQTTNATFDNSNTAPLISPPLKNIRIGSGFGMRKHPIYHKRMMHNGIDLSARYENVYSMFPGTVVKVGQDGRSGKFVTVRTGDYTISYCHLSQQLVKEKDFVIAGKNIAVSGNTGASTGPHLHITTKKDGKAFDPAILLNFILSQE